MLSKLLATLIISTVFTVQVNAAISEVRSLSATTSVKEELKTAYDELNYALTVEWDQKDGSFRAAQMETFNNVITNLKLEGITNDELMNFAKSQIKDANIAKDFENALSVVKNKLTGNEANQYITEAMKNSYASGANWKGEGGTSLGQFIVILAVVGACFAYAYNNAPPSCHTTNGYYTVAGNWVPGTEVCY